MGLAQRNSVERGGDRVADAVTFQNPPAEELYANKWRIWGVVMIGLFMALIDVTIVNISIPQLQQDFGASLDDVSWVLNAYNIMFAVLLISMGRLADQFGRRRFFLLGMSVFTAGSLFCALSTSLGLLIAFRVVQAVGAAILAPLALAMTALVFPPQQRGLGLALMAVVANAAAALGPPIGGVLVDVAGWPWNAGWHWIFLINVPIGVVGLALALRVLPETKDPFAGTKVDWWGMATIGGAVFCLTYGLVEANNKGWGSPEIVGLFAASVALAIAFAYTQSAGRFPMLTASLVHNRQFISASLALLLFGAGMMGTLFMTVLAFVELWHYSELRAALAVTPVPAMALVVAPLVGRISNRVSPRAFGVPAILAAGIAMVWLGQLPAEPDYWKVVGPLALLGAGVGATFPAVMIGSMGSIQGQELGLGSGIVNMSRQVGFAIGIAVLVAVFTGTVGDHLTDAQQVRDGYGAAFRVAGLCAFLAVPFAATMRKRPMDVVHAAREQAAAAAAG
jgi:EmrB/QacA subfamily drug resistance transporter